MIYPYLVAGASGAELTQTQLSEKLLAVNKIYRQVGLHFSAAPIEVVQNYKWSHFGLAKKDIARAIRDYEHKTDGVEVYFIGDNESVVDYDTRATGRANVDGIIIRSNASGVSLAHEIGHVCGLKDIYIDTNCQELHQPLREQWAPSDWSNGTGCRYYSTMKCPLDLIPLLLMHGVGVENRSDIPLGPIRGLLKDDTVSGRRNLGNAAVGRSAMLIYPPHTR